MKNNTTTYKSNKLKSLILRENSAFHLKSRRKFYDKKQIDIKNHNSKVVTKLNLMKIQITHNQLFKLKSILNHHTQIFHNVFYLAN